MAEQLNILPTTLIAGESIVKSITGVATTGYTLAYQFAAKTPLSVSCTVDAGVWQLNVTGANTLTFKYGNIRFAAMLTLTSTGATSCVDSGVIAVAASPLATSDYAASLTAIETAIANYATNENKRVTVEGAVSVEYKDLDDLLRLRIFYENEVAKQTGGRGSGPYFTYTEFR